MVTTGLGLWSEEHLSLWSSFFCSLLLIQEERIQKWGGGKKVKGKKEEHKKEGERKDKDKGQKEREKEKRETTNWEKRSRCLQGSYSWLLLEDSD
jgi:hypothetical protein